MEDRLQTNQNDPISSVRDAAVRVLPVQPEQADAVADQVRMIDRRTRAFVSEHPILSVAAALGLGFVVGRVLRG
jgi:ElaB/YqjD/DUF883 family membrane-anchored ribosome-binding protein